MFYNEDSMKKTKLSVGVDIADVARFRRQQHARHKNFYRTIFTDAEISYCLSKRDPYPHFAARFAAKEAVTKAVRGRTIFSIKDIEIINDKNGRPSARIGSKSARPVFLSLSHTKEYAIAFALWQP